MNDEEFEDVWKKLLEKFYPFGAEYYDPDKIEEKAKRKVKQILEEIEKETRYAVAREMLKEEEKTQPKEGE